MQSTSCQEYLRNASCLFPRKSNSSHGVHLQGQLFTSSIPSRLLWATCVKIKEGQKHLQLLQDSTQGFLVIHSLGDQQKGSFVGGLLESQLCAQEGSLSLFICSLSDRWLLRTQLVGSLRCPPSVCSSSGLRQETLPSAKLLEPSPSALSSRSGNTVYGGMESILKLCSWRPSALLLFPHFYSYSSYYFISLPHQFDFLLSSGKVLATILLHKCFLTSIQELS